MTHSIGIILQHAFRQQAQRLVLTVRGRRSAVIRRRKQHRLGRGKRWQRRWHVELAATVWFGGGVLFFQRFEAGFDARFFGGDGGLEFDVFGAYFVLKRYLNYE